MATGPGSMCGGVPSDMRRDMWLLLLVPLSPRSDKPIASSHTPRPAMYMSCLCSCFSYPAGRGGCANTKQPQMSTFASKCL